MDISIPQPSAAQASHQRTTDDLALDLSAYAGLRLDVARSGGKTYTLTLKDELLPRCDDGRSKAASAGRLASARDGRARVAAWGV
jgi:Complex I intermediate-associated protein 30 (CIA30)